MRGFGEGQINTAFGDLQHNIQYTRWSVLTQGPLWYFYSGNIAGDVLCYCCTDSHFSDREEDHFKISDCIFLKYIGLRLMNKEMSFVLKSVLDNQCLFKYVTHLLW